MAEFYHQPLYVPPIHKLTPEQVVEYLISQQKYGYHSVVYYSGFVVQYKGHTIIESGTLTNKKTSNNIGALIRYESYLESAAVAILEHQNTVMKFLETYVPLSTKEI